MILRTSMKASVLGLASLFAFSACGDNGNDDLSAQEAANVGEVGMALQLPGGAVVQTVHFTISGNGITPIQGDIDVSQDGATASLLRTLPAGNNYTVTLTATTSRGGDCLGSAMFNVLAHQTTQVNVLMQCTDQTTDGQVLVNGEFDVCPRVATISAMPTTLQVGGIVTLSATTVDADNDAITNAWTATAGTFANASALNTTYTCTVAGNQTLTLTATDSKGCARNATVGITCTGTTPVVCGNGVVQAGEQCDDSNTTAGDGCSPTCQIEPRCGDGVVNQASEQCDDGNQVNTDACNNQCQSARCGDGIVNQASEQCDDGNANNTDSCSNTCQNVVHVAVCGDGVREGTEQCDDGNTVDLDGCSPTCRTTATIKPACATCEAAANQGNCHHFTDNDIDVMDLCFNATGTAAAGPAAGQGKRDLCLALLDCVHRSGCAANDASECYCGTVAFGTCSSATSSASLNGACIAQFEAAAESTDPTVVTTRSGDLSYAVGPAFNLAICEELGGCHSACTLP